jgi:hypothetical protein
MVTCRRCRLRYPGIQQWLDAFVRNTFGDDEALAAFGPRDGRSAT